MNRLLAGLALATALLACTPTYNWRDVRFETIAMQSLLPCKPDRATRELPLGGQLRQVHMMGCEAGGAMFTITYTELGSEQEAAALVPVWKSASRATQAHYVQQGRQVFEAAVFGKPRAGDSPGALNQDAVETFFGSLRVPAS